MQASYNALSIKDIEICDQQFHMHALTRLWQKPPSMALCAGCSLVAAGTTPVIVY